MTIQTVPVEIISRWDSTIVLFRAEVDASIPLAGRIKAALEIAAKSRSDLTGSDLSRSDLSGSDLTGSNLRGSNLSGSNLRYSDLRDSNLRGSNLRYSNLTSSNLSGSNLSGSDLRDSDLRYSDLSGSDLTGSDLRYSGLVDGGQRSDGYRFVGWVKDSALMIRAGCRNQTVAEYRQHNAARTDIKLRDETTAILDHIETTARIRGLVP
jgi:uncharacterized protein YjbI with pentapeptide repeats